jgi:hypothetical protein
MHGGEQGYGRHCGGTDLDDHFGNVGQHRMYHVAQQADYGRADQEAPEKPDGTAVIALLGLVMAG